MFAKIIKHKLIDEEITITELARRIGTSRENLTAKIKRDNFCERDMLAIANALGLELKISLKDQS